MNRSRDVLGLLGALMLIVSSGVHSVLGWRGIHGELVVAHLPGDLMLGLQVAWQFGGAAMLTLGAVLALTYRQRLQGEMPSLTLARAVSVMYLVFGAWALGATGGDLFPLIFLIPGAFLAMGSMSRVSPATEEPVDTASPSPPVHASQPPAA
jgi:hypothetical protein